MASNPSLGPALVGVAGTLVITLSAQLFVIPVVQNRTRRRERWEKDLIDLDALLKQELWRGLQSLHSTSADVRVARSLGPYRLGRHKQLAQAESDRREASRVVGEQMARLSVLRERLAWVNRDSPYWKSFTTSFGWLAFTIAEAERERHLDPAHTRDDAFERLWGKAFESRLRFSFKVQDLAKTRKPPARPPLDTRLWHRLKMSPRWLVNIHPFPV